MSCLDLSASFCQTNQVLDMETRYLSYFEPYIRYLLTILHRTQYRI